jgi:hypothetical protein
MNKFTTYIAYLAIIISFLVLGLMGYWLLYPYNPVTYKTIPYPVLNENKTATVGGILKYSVDYCKTTNIYPTVIKRYVDGLIYETPAGRGVVYKGCRVQVVDNLVPSTLIPGKYKMEVIIEYQMNPIRKIIYTNYTEEFTITK